jgi:LCP family protein required for cell wall assembly
MASNPPDNDANARNDPETSDQRVTGRARVSPRPADKSVQPPPDERRQGTTYGRRATTPDPYRPIQYRSSAYRGMPYQDRPPSGPPPRRTRPHWGRIAFVGVLLLALLFSGGMLVSYLWAKGVDNRMRREDPFAALEGRPPKAVDGSLNILLLGTDSQDPDADPTSGASSAGPERSDTIVVMHIPASHDKAYMVSIPRDLWVHIPASQDGQNGDTMAKINAAYSWGGMALAVQTVEQYTGVRIDHVALVDFAGFVKVTDALGGVDMTVDQTITSIHPPYRTFQAGPRHFNGEEALDYVRQRYQFTDGDFTRMRHQQMFLKALLDKATSKGMLSNIGTMRDFVSAVADTMTVDKDFSLVDLGWQFRGLRSDDLVFMVSPNQGSATMGGQSVVISDRDKAASLYDAMAKDTLGAWVQQHGTGW